MLIQVHAIIGRIGVKMGALTAVQGALPTMDDMCKFVDQGMTINGVTLLEKHGCKSGSSVVGQ